MNSMTLSIKFEMTHGNLCRLIKKHIDSLNEFENVEVVTVKTGRGRPTNIYILNNEHTMLITLLIRDNSKNVSMAKFEIIKEYFSLRTQYLDHMKGLN